MLTQPKEPTGCDPVPSRLNTIGMVTRTLVVGAGFSGATVAQQLIERGDGDVTVIDRRDHVAGNAHTPELDDQYVHWYGPHIFHTNDDDTWAYANRFARFRRYTHQVKAIGSDDRLYSLPFSLQTFHELFGVTDPDHARQLIRDQAAPFRGRPADNVEDWCLQNIGPSLYNVLVAGYTRKMWNRDPKDLPASVIKRLPLRFDYNVDYFDDAHQGIPEHGYTAMVGNMLQGARVFLSANGGPELFGSYDRVYYTGPLDALCGYELGKLESRALRFDRYVTDKQQGCVQLNDCRAWQPHTRTTESWLFDPKQRPDRVWHVRETPDPQGEPAYPVNDDRNQTLHHEYKLLVKQRFPNVVPVGRMATFRYLDMHQAIAQALKAVRST